MLIDQPKLQKNVIPTGLQLPASGEDGAQFFVPGQGLFVRFGGEWLPVSAPQTPQEPVDVVSPLKADIAKLVDKVADVSRSQETVAALQANLERAVADHLQAVEQRAEERIAMLETVVKTVSVEFADHVQTLVMKPVETVAQPVDLSPLQAEVSALRNAQTRIQTQLTTLADSKIDKSGKVGLAGNLSIGGHRVTNVAFPEKSTDAATKGYVEMFAQGIHWVESVEVVTTHAITLAGLQTIGGRLLKPSERVLVQAQANPADNGIYLAAVGDWSRAADYFTPAHINTSAVFVIGDKSAWLQTSPITKVGVDPIKFTAFAVPRNLEGGLGISVAATGRIDIDLGAGLRLDGQDAVTLDLLPGGGLMLSKNNSGASLEQSALLALAPSGVQQGTYNNLPSKVTPFTVDTKGRVVAIGEALDVAPNFTNISGLPTTLRGYGITDAVSTNGHSIIAGSLSFKNGTTLLGGQPTPNQALLSTAKVSTVGDGRTHFGFLAGGEFVNYIRGARTQLDGNVVIAGELRVGSVQVDAELTALRAEVEELKALVKTLLNR